MSAEPAVAKLGAAGIANCGQGFQSLGLSNFSQLPPATRGHDLGEDRDRDLLRRDGAEIEAGRRLELCQALGRDAALPRAPALSASAFLRLPTKAT